VSLDWQHKLLSQSFTNVPDKNLWTFSFEKKCLMIFLRHFGCLFCKRMLTDLALVQEQLQKQGFQVVLIHQSASVVSQEFFNSFGLKNYFEISDPYRECYAVFKVNGGSLKQFLHPQLFFKIWESAQLGHKNSEIDGAIWQMPGLLILYEGKIVKKHQFRHAGEMPNFLTFSGLN